MQQHRTTNRTRAPQRPDFGSLQGEDLTLTGWVYDGPVQELTSLALRLEAAALRLGPGTSADRLHGAASTVARSIDAVRQVVEPTSDAV